MRALIQRVKKASVRPSLSEAKQIRRPEGATSEIQGTPVSQIGKGLLILLGVCGEDKDEDIQFLVDKITNLRIFEDRPSHSEATFGKMNLSLFDIKGEALIVSQFTLYADCRKGRRPSFTDAAQPGFAQEVYKKFVQKFKDTGLHVREGEFAAMMDVSLVNWGPVTIMLDTKLK